MNMSSWWRTWWSVVVFVATVYPVEAGIVVNWGGDYVTNGDSPKSLHPGDDPPPPGGVDSYEDPHKDTDPGVEYFGRLVSDSTAYFSSTVDPAGPNPEFFGGHVVEFDLPKTRGNGNDGTSNLWVVDNPQGDYLHVDVNPSNNLNRFAMLTYWKLGDRDLPYILDSQSLFSLKSTQDSSEKTHPDHVLRWVIKDAGKFYLSSFIDFTNNAVYSTAGNLLIADEWTEYTPTNLRSIFAPPQGSTKKGSLFTDITAVGFHVEYNDSNENGAAQVHYKINGFNVTLDGDGPGPQETVPEPGTFLLGLFGVGGAAVRRWRRRRQSLLTESIVSAVSC